MRKTIHKALRRNRQRKNRTRRVRVKKNQSLYRKRRNVKGKRRLSRKRRNSRRQRGGAIPFSELGDIPGRLMHGVSSSLMPLTNDMTPETTSASPNVMQGHFPNTVNYTSDVKVGPDLKGMYDSAYA